MKIFECPECNNEAIDRELWFDKYVKSDGLVYFNCKFCKAKLGSTLPMMGLVHPTLWLKSKEIK